MMPTYFTLKEMTHTDTGIPNAPQTWGQYSNLLRVANFLDGLRKWFGGPIVVTSGFRSTAVNERVGGSKTSAHLDGLAVDIKPKSGLHADYMRILDYLYPLVTCRRIDQLIVYCKTPQCPDLGVKWIHIGFREDSADNRCQTIYK